MKIAYAEIRQALQSALAARGFSGVEPLLQPIEPPRAWGVTTNVCFILAGKAAADEIARETAGLAKAEVKKRTSELTRAAGERLAREIAAELSPAGSMPYVQEIAAEGAYINFYYDQDALAEHVVAAVEQAEAAAPGSFGKGAPVLHDGRPKRIMVEYAQPNTHKDFHVGHLRNASIGQAIANLLEHAGCEVLKATYIGDVGAHVAKAIWASHVRHLKDPMEIIKASILFDESCIEESQITSKSYSYSEGIENPNIDNPDQVRPLDLSFPSDQDASNPLSYWSELYKQGSKLFNYIENVAAIKVAVNYGHTTDTLYATRDILGYRIWLSQWESGDIQAREEWLDSRDQCVRGFREIFSELHINFESQCWFFESTVDDTKLGQKAAAELKHLNIATIDTEGKFEGALFVDFAVQADALKPDGTPVFADSEKKRIRQLGKMTILRSDGTSLYQTKELGLAKYKFDNFAIDESLYVVGAEQKLYFEQVFAILRLWGFPNAENCKHISYELVVLPSGKMSSREGNIVSYRELRDEAVARALKITQEKGIAGDAEQTAKDIAIAAIKYTMLQVTGSQQITFDFEQALSFDGRAAPYLQYAYARTRKLVEGLDPASADGPVGGQRDVADTSFPVRRTAVSASNAHAGDQLAEPASTQDLSKYTRRLPHWRLPGAVCFVTWRLAQGQPTLSEQARDIVLEALRFFAGERYKLFAWVVMDDHVHVLVQPLGELALEEQVRRWKSVTANKLQRECGYMGHVWLDEYMDRIQRNEDEFWETAQYIVNNPLKRWPERVDYPWMGWDLSESTGTDKEADTAVRPTEERHPSEVALTRLIARFPEVVQEAAAKYEPATLCTYLYDLAGLFAEFYRDCRVLDAPEPQRGFRRRLAQAFRCVMRTGFKLLALPLPEAM